MKLTQTVVGITALVVAGCANRMNTMVAPAYQGKTTPVPSLGLTGGGASVAFPAFVQKGYKIVDISSTNNDPIEEAKKKSIPFLATVDKVGTDGSSWDGFFDYSLRVTETENGSIVWSATAEYGQGGLLINQVKSSNKAMHDIVEKFSENFPPK